MTSVNDGTTSTHTVTFYNTEGASATPTAVQYKLMDGKLNVLVDWTSVTPSSTVTVTVSAANNTYSEATGARRYLTVKATNVDASVTTAEITYLIDDFKGIS